MSTNFFAVKDRERGETRSLRRNSNKHEDCTCCSKEKQWDRVIHKLRPLPIDHDEPSTSIPSYWLILFFGVLVLFAYFTELIENQLPRARSDSETGTVEFSEERAMQYLREIVGNGSRVAGTPYHLEKTVDLKALIDDVAATARQQVITHWQMNSNDFFINYANSHVNCYENVSNVLALLLGSSGLNADGTTNSSILVNCHYDSVPVSPGASDDAVFCAVMIETLRALSRRTQRLQHNIIFLFNGAEENLLQGSHAFLNHPWAKGVTGLINLDAAGINGKSDLFQVTDPRILNAYRRNVWMPTSQSIAEPLFASGIVPSDTDFRIFRDFGQIYGVDIAFTELGHVYHTRFDSLELLEPGVLQHSGDMLLAMTTDVADNSDFDIKCTPSAAVYWEYLHVFMVTYGYTTANVMDSLVMLLALGSVYYCLWILGLRWSSFREFLWSILSRIVPCAAGIAVVFLLTAISVATTPQLRYLSHSWIVVPTVWVPFLATAVGLSQSIDAYRTGKSGLNRIRRTAQAMAATRLLTAIVLFILLFVSSTVAGRYILMIPLLNISVAAFINLTLLKKWFLQAWHFLLLNFILSLPTLLFLYGIALRLNTFLLPIMGRSASLNPDYTVALINVGIAILVAVPVSGLELLFSRKRLWIVLGGAMLSSVVIMFLPLQPYSDNIQNPALQRHYWFHTERVSYDKLGSVISNSTGVWLARVDAMSPDNVEGIVKQAGLDGITFGEFKKDHSEDCERYVYCNFPLVSPRTIPMVDNSIWVDFSEPARISPETSLRLENRLCADLSCTLVFTMDGPPHMLLSIWPRQEVNLTSWSFNSPVEKTVEKDNRPVYFIYYSRATYREEPYSPVMFHITLEVPLSFNLDSDELLDVSHIGHWIYHNDYRTPDFNRMINAMPAWTNVASYSSSRHNYVF